MSNDIKSGSTNEQSGSEKNDPNHTMNAPKSGQQAQGTPRTDKGVSQQGGSDQKSGQQSQGGSRADNDGMRQAGSTTIVNDPKKSTDATQKSGSPK